MLEKSNAFIRETSKALDDLGSMVAELQSALAIVSKSLREDSKIFSFGNGGAASISQHFVSELLGRLERNRPPFAAIDLGGNSATMTAISNDFGFEEVFARQVATLLQKGDTLVALSTSGRSQNVRAAVDVALRNETAVILITGKDSPMMYEPNLLHIALPSSRTAVVQHLQMAFLHALCLEIDDLFCGDLKI